VRSPGSLRDWCAELLPAATTAARAAAYRLLAGLCRDFTASLSGLARELAGAGTTAAALRQQLRRWLGRPAWQAERLYPHLRFRLQRLLAPHRGPVPLLLDFTYLGTRWSVLQVSVPWQRRALPLYRVVLTQDATEEQQTELVFRVLHWLAQQLPGPRRRYVVVMDRGFPSHVLIKFLQEHHWRYVLRINSTWKMTHARYTGSVGAGAADLRPGARPRYFAAAELGNRNKGRTAWCVTHVVWWYGVGQEEPWLLVTSEARAGTAQAIYRQRMQIEGEFRDLKGYLGLDHLEKWEDRERVASFLAWVAVYEWRLALLFLHQHLEEWGRKYLQVGGKLSWIRVTREWVRKHFTSAVELQT
jgi:hypothetical protein